MTVKSLCLLACTANIFVGLTEAPLLIKPYLSTMTRSELFSMMVAGFASIAGSVMGVYLAMGIPATALLSGF